MLKLFGYLLYYLVFVWYIIEFNNNCNYVLLPFHMCKDVHLCLPWHRKQWTWWTNDDDEVTDEVEELEEEMLDLAAAPTATLDIATR